MLTVGGVDEGKSILFKNIVACSRAAVFLNRDTHELHFVGVALDSLGNFAKVYKTVAHGLTLIELEEQLHGVAASARAILRNEMREELGEGTTGWTGE